MFKFKPNPIYSNINTIYNLSDKPLCEDWSRQLLLIAQAGDVEKNPGPTGKLYIGSYNIRGCNNYNKLKRVTTYISNKRNSIDSSSQYKNHMTL